MTKKLKKRDQDRNVFRGITLILLVLGVGVVGFPIGSMVAACQIPTIKSNIKASRLQSQLENIHEADPNFSVSEPVEVSGLCGSDIGFHLSVNKNYSSYRAAITDIDNKFAEQDLGIRFSGFDSDDFGVVAYREIEGGLGKPDIREWKENPYVIIDTRSNNMRNSGEIGYTTSAVYNFDKSICQTPTTGFVCEKGVTSETFDSVSVPVYNIDLNVSVSIP